MKDEGKSLIRKLLPLTQAVRDLAGCTGLKLHVVEEVRVQAQEGRVGPIVVHQFSHLYI